MAKQRMVILPIDDVTAILADYASSIGFPPDAQPVRWKLNPAERKLALEVEAESLDGEQPTEEIRFTLRRAFGLGGG